MNEELKFNFIDPCEPIHEGIQNRKWISKEEMRNQFPEKQDWQIQGSKAWKEFRISRIGASEAPILMNASPWSTPFILWERKVGLLEDQLDEQHMLRGRELEPEVLKKFNIAYGLDMQPKVVVNPLYNWHIASLDGYDEKTDTFCEIKCPNKDDHYCAKEQCIPKKYIWQVIHQFMATGCEKMYYISYRPQDEQPMVVIEVMRDHFEVEKFDELFKVEEKFYECLTTFTPPELTERDYTHSDDQKLKSLLDSYKLTCELRKSAESREEELKNQIIDMCKGQSTICNGMKVRKSYRLGSIEYGKINALKDINLNLYRKPSTESWRISE